MVEHICKVETKLRPTVSVELEKKKPQMMQLACHADVVSTLYNVMSQIPYMLDPIKDCNTSNLIFNIFPFVSLNSLIETHGRLIQCSAYGEGGGGGNSVSLHL